METRILFPYFLTILSCCYSTRLPESFEKCNLQQSDLNECLSQAIHGAIQQLDEPVPQLGLPSIDPFKLESLRLELGDARTSLQQIWSNVTIFGLSEPISTVARWTSGAVNTLDLEMSYSRVLFTSEYEAHGAVVLLPVNTRTSFSCEFVTGGTFKLSYKIKRSEENNRYFELISTTLLMVPNEVKFSLEKFFDNQILNDELNAEMWKNGNAGWDWVEEFLDVYDPFFDALLRNVLERVPVNRIFDGVE